MSYIKKSDSSRYEESRYDSKYTSARYSPKRQDSRYQSRAYKQDYQRNNKDEYYDKRDHKKDDREDYSKRNKDYNDNREKREYVREDYYTKRYDDKDKKSYHQNSKDYKDSKYNGYSNNGRRYKRDSPGKHRKQSYSSSSSANSARQESKEKPYVRKEQKREETPKFQFVWKKPEQPKPVDKQASKEYQKRFEAKQEPKQEAKPELTSRFSKQPPKSVEPKIDLMRKEQVPETKKQSIEPEETYKKIESPTREKVKEVPIFNIMPIPVTAPSKVQLLIQEVKRLTEIEVPSRSLMMLEAYKKFDLYEFEVERVNPEWKKKLEEEKGSSILLKTELIERTKYTNSIDAEILPRNKFRLENSSFTNPEIEQKMRRVKQQLSQKLRGINQTSRRLLLMDADIEILQRKKANL